jgi:trehalose 6-phosphate synthase/phosphatase
LSWIDVQVTDEVSEFVELSLFPVFHSSTSTSSIEKNASGFEKLSAMNAEAADTLQKTIALIEGSGAVIVLVYGISLMLLPKLIHARLPEITIAFMFNSAFPDGELYRTIPKRTELLLGLLGGANLVITGDDKDIVHMKEAATLLLGLDCSKDVIVCGDVRCRIVCMPLVENSSSKPEGGLKEEKESMLLEIGKGVA